MDPLARVHLNGLRAVEAAGRFGSLAKASAHLGVSPGAVSQQIIKTERQLGRKIFTRTPRGLEPTAFGVDLIAQLSIGFRALGSAVALTQPVPETCLTVSVAPILAAKWLVPRLARFTADRPDLAIRIDATVALSTLDGDGADVAIRVGHGSWPDLRAEKLLDQHVFPVCAPARARLLRTPADLATVPVLRDAGSIVSWSTWLRPHALDEGILRSGSIFSDSGLCLDAAAADHGVMLAWQTVAHDALKEGRVVAPFATSVPTGLAYWFVSARSRPLRPVEAAFRDWLGREMAALQPDRFQALLGRG